MVANTHKAAELGDVDPRPARPLRLTHAQMYARLLASDASFNGRFFTGVLTTGIYCLPSCRARKPKSENVRFFPSCEAAREAGLRACRKCHPDDFARGADPVLESVETLVGELRARPADFPDVRAVVRRSGFGSTRVFELLRQHYHATPAELLLRARLARARELLLGTELPLLELAAESGFESSSSFHENFKRVHGLTPVAYRELRGARAFRVQLPEGYPLGYLKRALGRDAQSLTERLEGARCLLALRLSTGPTLLRLRISQEAVEVELDQGAAPEAHAVVVGLLGLEQDAPAFAQLARKLGLARLVAGRTQLRICQTISVYDGLLWSIIGQQINLPFACTLKRRLIERLGTPVGEGLMALPTPQAVAELPPEELLPLQFSRQKADYVTSVSCLVAEGMLNLEALKGMSATRAERTLLAVRGLGPWSVNYVMMRSLGFMDCVPYGDTGVTSGLLALLKLEERPDIDATRRLMLPFSPYRSLATNQLWQFQKEMPE